MLRIFLLIFMMLTYPNTSASASPDCKYMQIVDFDKVNSKEDIENVMFDIIRSQRSEHSEIDWQSISRCFNALGDRYSTEFYPGGGFDGADIYRFTVDKSDALTPFTSAPGASNDVFTAIVNIASDGRIAIVRRGGTLEWLK